MLMSKLYIMRGLPGSGKSTWADDTAENYGIPIICSADDYFRNNWSDDCWDYIFDPKKLGEAHAWCRAQADMAMNLCAEAVFVDNTNMQRWEFAPYLRMAKHYRYDIEEVLIGSFDTDSIKLYAERNSHGVSLEVIEKMARKFEV